MIVWTAVFAALMGLIAGDLGIFGALLGGIAGAALGVWLRNIVRHEVARGVAQGIADYRESEKRLRDREVAPTPAAAPPPPAAVASVVRTGAPEPAAEKPRELVLPARAAAPMVRAPAPPPEPSIFDHWFEAAKGWLLGGNTIVRGGLILLFIGLSFLASFAANAGLFPIEIRLALVGLFGVALLVIGLRKRVERPSFGLALQGGGVAILYLTVFAAGRIYTLLPPLASFGLMILFCGLGCALALRQNSLLMAFASFAGGFAVPVLLGGESRTPLPLFAYYSILNLAILFIAWKRSWRPLNLLGFAATFLMAAAWGLTRYGPEHYLVCQMFLALSVAIYLATAILYAHNTPGRLGNAADQTLLFGPAIAGFGLQLGLVEPFEYGAAFSALAFALIYTALAVWTARRRDSGMRLIHECLIAIGVGFVTLAVPLALGAEWTSAAWALEGAGAFWVGKRQERWMARAFGLMLMGVAALMFLSNSAQNVSALPLLNTGFVGGVLIALPLMLAAWWMREPLGHSDSRFAKIYAPIEWGLRHALFLGGFFFAALAIALEVTRQVPGADPVAAIAPWAQPLAVMLGILVAMWGAAWFGRRNNWPVATWPSWGSLALMGLVVLIQIAQGEHLLAWPGLLAWGAALALHADLLRRNDADRPEGAQGAFHLIHAAGVWLIAVMLADTLQLAIDRAALWDTSWAGVLFLVSATLILLGLTLWAGKPGTRWPLVPHRSAYLWTAAIPVAALTGLGAVVTAVGAEGVTDPLPYIPLLNPVDLSLALALVALALWRRTVSAEAVSFRASAALAGPGALAAGGGLAFLIVNTIWLRTAHHWLGVGWSGEELMASAIVQTGLSILWTLMAMGLMLFAHRKAARMLWLVGAGLLGVVVVKLLLVDMSSSETWVKAVAFVGVGVIMLAIGYFVPIPPSADQPDAKEKELAA